MTYDVHWFPQKTIYGWSVVEYDTRRDKAVAILRSHGITDFDYGRDNNGFFFKFEKAADAVLFRMVWDGA
ncbi:hypothetical protein D3C87_637420 [compost metagenome]